MQKSIKIRFSDSVSLRPKESTVHFCSKKDIFSGLKKKKTIFVFDANTFKICEAQGLLTAVDPQLIAMLPAGEEAKQWMHVLDIIRLGLENDAGRDSYIVGVGGGVVCDVAAFAASVYMRGCNLVLVPTTLLAMVDAAVGGKTAVNFDSYKNMVGTFYPAVDIRVAPDLLETLPEREYRSGLAEVIKTAMLGDRELFEILMERRLEIMSFIRRQLRSFKKFDAKDPVRRLLEDIIYRCVKVKSTVVEEDLTEAGVRAHLNLGHTFGHALETVTEFSRFTHGEAVSWGIGCAMNAGLRLGVTVPGYGKTAKELLKAYGFDLAPSGVDKDAVLSAMVKDKKSRGGTLRFVLQRNICDTFVTSIPENTVKDAMDVRISTPQK